jgi:hypothetical protein
MALTLALTCVTHATNNLTVGITNLTPISNQVDRGFLGLSLSWDVFTLYFGTQVEPKIYKTTLYTAMANLNNLTSGYTRIRIVGDPAYYNPNNISAPSSLYSMPITNSMLQQISYMYFKSGMVFSLGVSNLNEFNLNVSLSEILGFSDNFGSSMIFYLLHLLLFTLLLPPPFPCHNK